MDDSKSPSMSRNTFLSLTRSLDLRSSLLPLGKADASIALLSLIRSLLTTNS